MDISSHIKNLARGIAETNEFKEFKSLRKQYNSNKEFMKRINEYKEVQFQLYQAHLNDKSSEAKRKAELNKKADALASDQDILKYLKAETDFHNIIYDTYNRIAKEVEASLK